MNSSKGFGNFTGDSYSCSQCFVNERSLILLHFTLPPKPIKIMSSVLLVTLVCTSVCLNTSSIYFIWREVRRRTHVNLLLSAQSLVDILINLLVMLPISILVVGNSSSRPSYHLCLLLSFLDHWFHSITMLTMAEIIVDRYKVIVLRQLSTITRKTEKSLALITVLWVSTFALSICYLTSFLQRTNWGSLGKSCQETKNCDRPKNIFQWIEELISRILPFVVIFYCFFKMTWMTYKSRHRVGVKNSIANWKTVLVGIYAKSVKTCLLMMTFFLLGTLPELAISIAVNLNKSVESNILLFATWLRFSLTAVKPVIYMVQNGKRITFCWFTACCRNVNVAKLVTLAKRPSVSVVHSTNQDGSNFKVSFTKTHDLFAINLQIEDPDASVSNNFDRMQMIADGIDYNKGNIVVKTI